MHAKRSAIAAIITADATDAVNATHCTAAALALMTHYAQQPCPLVAHAIAQQLGHLSRHRSEGRSRTLQSFASALLSQWRNLACGATAMVRH